MMKKFLSINIFTIILLCISSLIYVSAEEIQNTSQEYKITNGSYPVEVIIYNWVDSIRNREVPVKIYYPKSDKEIFPIIIFSHGLGGSRDGYEYLGQYWASHGYVSVHIQHKGSDIYVWKNSKNPYQDMKKAIKNVNNFINRPKDVSFAIDRMEKMNNENTLLKEKLDMKKIGVAGHSFGAFTALASSGRVLISPFGKKINLSDPRIKACIAMSSPAQSVKRDRKSYANFSLPCFHMTGTLDDSPISNTKADARRIPFDCINKGDQYLVIFKDGDHMIFSDTKLLGDKRKNDALFHDLIQISSTASGMLISRMNPMQNPGYQTVVSKKHSEQMAHLRKR